MAHRCLILTPQQKELARTLNVSDEYLSVKINSWQLQNRDRLGDEALNTDPTDKEIIEFIEKSKDKLEPISGECIKTVYNRPDSLISVNDTFYVKLGNEFSSIIESTKIETVDGKKVLSIPSSINMTTFYASLNSTYKNFISRTGIMKAIKANVTNAWEAQKFLTALAFMQYGYKRTEYNMAELLSKALLHVMDSKDTEYEDTGSVNYGEVFEYTPVDKEGKSLQPIKLMALKDNNGNFVYYSLDGKTKIDTTDRINHTLIRLRLDIAKGKAKNIVISDENGNSKTYLVYRGDNERDDEKKKNIIFSYEKGDFLKKGEIEDEEYDSIQKEREKVFNIQKSEKEDTSIKFSKEQDKGYNIGADSKSGFNDLQNKFGKKSVISVNDTEFDFEGKTIRMAYKELLEKFKSKIDNLEESEKEDYKYNNFYLPLWRMWADQNKRAISNLRKKVQQSGNTIVDKQFLMQARALADILNEKLDIKRDLFKNTSSNATKLVVINPKKTYNDELSSVVNQNAKDADIVINITKDAKKGVNGASNINDNNEYQLDKKDSDIKEKCVNVSFDELSQDIDTIIERIKAKVEERKKEGKIKSSVKFNITGNSLYELNQALKSKNEDESVFNSQDNLDNDAGMQEFVSKLRDSFLIENIITSGNNGISLAINNIAYKKNIPNQISTSKKFPSSDFYSTAKISNKASSIRNNTKSEKDYDAKVNSDPLVYYRDEAEENKNVLYVFTDNADRSSGNSVVSNDSKYAKRYGVKNISHPSKTSALVRGLDNAFAITTQKSYKKGEDPSKNNFTDNDAELFKETVHKDIDYILDELRENGNYQEIRIPQLFDTAIANISKARTEKLYNILLEEYNRLLDGINELNEQGRNITITTKMEIRGDEVFLKGNNGTLYSSKGLAASLVQKKLRQELTTTMSIAMKNIIENTTEEILDYETDTTSSDNVESFYLEYSFQELKERIENIAHNVSNQIDDIVYDFYSNKKEIEESLIKELLELKDKTDEKSVKTRRQKRNLLNKFYDVQNLSIDDPLLRQFCLDRYTYKNLTGLTAIAAEMKERYIERAEYDPNPELQKHYKIAVENFKSLFEEAKPLISKMENLSFEIVEEGDEEGSVNAGEGTDSLGWTFKARFTDPHSTVSKRVKSLLNNLILKDNEGNDIIDRYGHVKYMNGDHAYNIILDEGAEMIDSDDFYVKDASTPEEMFPMLNKASIKYPPLKDIIYKLYNAREESNGDDSLISQCYVAFRKDFISLYIHKDGKIIPCNEQTRENAMKNSILNAYEGKLELDLRYKSIYGSESASDKMEAINASSNLLQEVFNTIKDLNSSDPRDVEELQDKILSGDSESLELAHNIATVLRTIGVNIEDSYMNKLLNSYITDFIKSEHKDNKIYYLSNTINGILEDARKNVNNSNYHLVSGNSSRYKTIASLAGVLSELDNMVSAHLPGGKTVHSYSAPNFITTLSKKLSRTDTREKILEEFKKYKWFYKNGEFRNFILRKFNDNDNVLNKLTYREIKMNGDTEFDKWTPSDLLSVLLNEFYAEETSNTESSYAYYNYNLFADSPAMATTRLPKFNDTSSIGGKSLEDQLLPLFEDVIMQELDRINLVEKEKALKDTDPKKWKELEKQNFHNNGDKFCFFPELNSYKVNTEEIDENGNPIQKKFLTYIRELISDSDKTEEDVSNAIQNAVKDIMNSKFAELRNDIKNTYEISDDDIVKMVEGKSYMAEDNDADGILKSWFWNSTYMQTQLIQLMNTDIAYAKDMIDFQKRFKQCYAAGNRLNTNSRYGRKVQRTLILKDIERNSYTYLGLKKTLNRAFKEGRLTQEQADNIANAFKGINIADAQAYRNPASYRSVLDMEGVWTDDMEEAFNRITEGKWDYTDFKIIWQTLKPFIFTMTDKVNSEGGIERVPMQCKNSEFLSLAFFSSLITSGDDSIFGDSNSKFYRGIGQFFKKYPDIDVIQFESAIKAGGQGKIELGYDNKKVLEQIKKLNEDNIIDVEAQTGRNDYKGLIEALDNYLDTIDINDEEAVRKAEKLYEDVIDSIEPDASDITDIIENAIKPENEEIDIANGNYNKNVVHEINYNDWMEAQPNPEHLLDQERATSGSQFTNIITANLSDRFKINIKGKELGKKETISLYQALNVENYLEKFRDIEGKFATIEDLQSKLLKMIEGNPKYGKDIKDALKIVTVTNPHTGEQVKVFNLPPHMPSIGQQIEDLCCSMFKNNVTKQKINGGNAVLAASVGLSRKLKVVRDDNGVIKGVQCYLPAWSRSFFEPLLKGTDGKLDISNINISKIPEDMRKLIGYRIPTEDKYSMLPLIVEGFLPPQNGSSVMVAADVVTMAGSDFDVDKLFLRIPNFIEKNGKFEKVDYGDIPTNIDDIWDFPKTLTKKQRDNLKMDIEYAILTSDEGSEQMSRSGTFDPLKKIARKFLIIEDSNIRKTFAEKHNVDENDYDKINEIINNTSLKDIDKFLKGGGKVWNVNMPQYYMYFHQQNSIGGGMVGIMANASSIHTKLQGLGIKLKDKYEFLLNNRNIAVLDNIYNEFKESIQTNLSYFQAASVDNVKDPVLAALGLNMQTSGMMIYMIRMGIPCEEASLFFKTPFVTKGNYDSLTTAIDTLKKSGIEFTVPKLKEGKEKENITTKELFDSMIFCNNNKRWIKLLQKMAGATIELEGENQQTFYNQEAKNNWIHSQIAEMYKEYLNNAEFKRGFDNMMRCSAIYNNMSQQRKFLSNQDRIMRADSPNNALTASLNDAMAIVERVEEANEKACNDLENPFTCSNSKFTGVNFKNLFVVNNLFTEKNTDDEIRQILKNSAQPYVQAAYSLGIEIPFKVMGKYFLQGDEQVNKWIKLLFPFNREYDSKAINNFIKSYITYNMTKIDRFGEYLDSKRAYSLYTFPAKFLSIVNSIPELKDKEIIKHMTVENGNIIYKRDTKLTPMMKDIIRREFTSLITSDNPEVHNFAVSLFNYCFYHDGFTFGPNNFGWFLDDKFWSQFPDALEQMRFINKNGRIEPFIDQFVSQNPNLVKTISNNVTFKDNYIIISEKEVLKQCLEKRQPKEGKSIYRDYVKIQFNSVDENGEKIVNYKLYKRNIFSSAGNNLVYEEIPIIKSDYPIYDAGRTVKQLKDIYQVTEENKVTISKSEFSIDSGKENEKTVIPEKYNHIDINDVIDQSNELSDDEIRNIIISAKNTKTRLDEISTQRELSEEEKSWYDNCNMILEFTDEGVNINGDNLDLMLLNNQREKIDKVINESVGECS